MAISPDADLDTLNDRPTMPGGLAACARLVAPPSRDLSAQHERGGAHRPMTLWHMLWQRRRWDDGAARSGQAIVVMALAFTALMGMVALAVDIGNVTLQRRNLQGLADAAALTGAQIFVIDNAGQPSITGAGYQAARDYLMVSGIGTTCDATGDPECLVAPSNQYTPSNQYIRVAIIRQVPYTFARIFAVTGQTIQAQATARVARPLLNSDAIVSLNDITVQGTGALVVIGNTVAHGEIRLEPGFSGDIVPAENSQVIARSGFNPNAQSIVDPASAALIDPNAVLTHPDPIARDLAAGLGTLPAVEPRPTFTCDDAPVIIDVNVNPSATSEPQSDSSCWKNYTVKSGAVNFRPNGKYYGDIIVESGATANFYPGRYRSITIRGNVGAPKVTDAIFNDQEYYIFGDFRIEEVNSSGLGSPDTSLVEVRNNLGWVNGVFMQVQGTVETIGRVHYQLFGHRQHLDIVFHIVYINSGSQVVLQGTIPSQIIGSIYAPVSRVALYGNKCNVSSSNCDFLITRGGTNTQRGGRVVGHNIELKIRSVAGPDEHVASFPPIDNDFEIVPILMPNSP